mmetsp:Transcript_8055/g.13402  ORF Transcript_8055/g.13402 Transcript_8055/m.13402 type:complete len:229 (-) Transcript_8055:1043-1729(-)
MKYSRLGNNDSPFTTSGGYIHSQRNNMADITARDWSAQYEGLKKRIQNQRMNGVPFSSEDKISIDAQINVLDAQLKTMGANVLQYELTASEVARRGVLIENMKKITANAFSRSGGSGATIGSAGSAGGSQQAQRQADIMKQQDEMILELGSGVDRLHDKARVIGDETKTHTRLLDDLDTNVEIATAALQAEAAHAAEIKEKGQVCYMYICIAVEVAILLLLIILAFSA